MRPLIGAPLLEALLSGSPLHMRHSTLFTGWYGAVFGGQWRVWYLVRCPLSAWYSILCQVPSEVSCQVFIGEYGAVSGVQ